jgi:tripartite-type tricarboxylate transporter receptor subunit TctC
MFAVKFFAGVSALAASLGVLAQTPTPPAVPKPDFPNRLVRFVVPFPGGSGPEMVVRMMNDKLQKKWGHPVIVEGKPGANGALAIASFKQGSTDGHDLLLIDGSTLALSPHLYKNLPFDVARDFEPITPMFKSPFFVLASSQSKHRTVADIVAAAQAAPGKLNYGSWGVGSFGHLGALMLANTTNTQMEHIAYKDTNQLFMAVTTGEVDFALGSYATVTALQGRMKAIAVAQPTRHPVAPDVPTVGESGGPRGFEASGWTMFVAPKGLPPAVLDMLKRDIDAALNEPDIKARMQIFGWETMEIPRTQIPAFIAAESAKYGELIRRTKLSLD